MRLFSAMVVACLSSSLWSPVSVAGTDEVIQDAIRQGAHVVECENAQCQDRTTHYAWREADAPDGIYLIYPNTPDGQAKSRKTQSQLRPSL